MASSTAAASRTVRVTAPSMVAPAHPSPRSGAWLTRPRDGLRPTSPHSEAGMRIEPPPSLAWPTATIAAATAAALPPGRAAGRVVEVPRVAGRAVGQRLGRDRAAQLGRVGPADGDEPGAPEAPPQRRVVRRDVADRPQRPGAAVVGLAGHRRPEVLDDHRHAGERSVAEGLAGLGQRPLVARVDDRVELRVEPLGGVDRRRHQLLRRHLPPPHPGGLRGGVQRGEITAPGHGRSP